MKLLALKSIVIMTAIGLYACGGSNDNQNTAADDSSQTISEQPTEAETATTDEPSSNMRYEIESGVVKYKMNVMGMDTDIDVYFDNYGDKEASIATAKVAMMGMNIETKTRTVTKDGYQYNIDENEKSGTKMKVQQKFNFQNFDARKLSGDMKKVYEEALANATDDTFLGKACKVVTLKFEEQNVESKLWLWKNISLKYQAKTPQGAFEMAAVSVEEKAVDQVVFEIPADIEFKEVSMKDLEKQLEKLGQ